ncbi:MAG: hypothetical protein CMO44_12240 [Verrucomicrobiales bacterium]|nr:hypothetical protein [Verrucomicrobiales bacterium]
MEKFSTPTDFLLKSFKIFKSGTNTDIEIKKLVANFEYIESIVSPFVVAAATIVDSAGLIGALPIKGGERVVIDVQTNMSESPIRYEMVIWKVANRYARQNKQTYSLGLISPEALQNEVTRVNEPLEGNPEGIIKKVIIDENYIGSKKDFASEPSLLETKIIPTKQRPFDLITQLAVKSISPKAKFGSNNTSNKNKSDQQIKGSGGFFFWETRRGYNFFAVDSLCADEKNPLKSDRLNVEAWGAEPDEPYTERLGNIGDGADERFTIKKSVFESEVDTLASLRVGKYSSLLVFFNHSTGAYEEYVYKIKDSYDNMAHLGGQESLSLIPVQEMELSDHPSRMMSIFMDHETWHNEPGVASPEQKDGAEKPTKFADWQKYYMAQSISRYKLLANQKLSVVIPGNAEICAGDRINVRLVSKLPNEEGKGEPYDLESSGQYLIQEVTHSYDPLSGSNGVFYTTLRLMRDSYGQKNKVSKHNQ